jgi:protein-tyrosine kinase
MDLIHRVTQRLERAGSPNAPAAPGGEAAKAPAISATPTSAPVSSEARAESHGPLRSREFALEFDSLAAQGFITPVSRTSRLSEEFRLIKRRLLNEITSSRAGRQKWPNVILITSARPGEGKTFCTINLAMSLVLDEHRPVLVIDGDIVQGAIGKSLGIKDSRGLADCLRDPTLPLANVLLRDSGHNFSVLPVGTAVETATDLFSGTRMRDFIADISQRYADRVILIDSAPLLSRTESFALAAQVGQVLMVVEAQRTSQAAVRAAIDLLASNENVSLVLNKAMRESHSEQFGSYYVDNQAPARATHD